MTKRFGIVVMTGILSSPALTDAATWKADKGPAKQANAVSNGPRVSARRPTKALRPRSA